MNGQPKGASLREAIERMPTLALDFPKDWHVAAEGAVCRACLLRVLDSELARVEDLEREGGPRNF